MLNSINLKNLTAKAIIGILMVGGMVSGSSKQANASNGVQGLEIRYQESAFNCTGRGQENIDVYIYNRDNEFLATLSKGEKFTTSTIDSVENLQFRYQFDNEYCKNARYYYSPNINSYSSGNDEETQYSWNNKYNVAPDSLLLGTEDPIPTLGGSNDFDDNQASVSEMLSGLDSYEELYLVELWTDDEDNSAYDLQDVVLVVDNNPESIITSSNVDVELVLAVDVSSSVDDGEFAIQRDGYVSAFSDQTIQDAIMALPNGLAVNMMFWSSDRDEPGKVSVHDIGWYKLIKNGDEIDGLDEFVEKIRGIQRSFDSNQLQTLDGINIQNGTDLALGIREAKVLLEDDVNGYVGTNKIIDISGDGLSDDTPITQTDIDYVQTYIDENNLDIENYLEGRNSCGRGHVGAKSLENEVEMQYVFCPPVLRARDTAIGAGITINGLPINATSESINREDEVGDYYLFNVLGGPDGAFDVDTVFNQEQFAAAATQKILAEIDPTEKPNNAPTAVDDFGETLVNRSITIDVLDNDFDINKDTLSIVSVNDVQGGEAEIVNNEVVFTAGDTPGKYTFNYIVTDDDATDPKTATANITVEVFGFAD